MKLVDFAVELIVKYYLLDQGAVRLPSEREMAIELKISRVTIRKALDVLTQRNLIFQYPGGRTRYINSKLLQETFNISDNTQIDDSLLTMLNAATGSPNFDENTNLNFKSMDLAFPSELVNGYWHNCMRRFSNTHHGLKINVAQYKPNTEQNREDLSPFDVLQCVTSDALSYMYHKTTQPLEAYLSFESAFSENRFDPLLWRDSFAHKHLGCIPYGTSVTFLAGLRRDWQGINIPNQWGWGEFLETADYLAKKHNKKIGKISNPFFLLNSFGIVPYFYTGKVVFDKSKEALMRRVAALASSEINANPAQDLLDNKHLVSYAFNTTIPSLNANPEFVFLPFPCEENGYIGRHTIGIYLAKNTTQPIEACQFIADIVSLKNQRALAKLKHFIPAVKNAQELYFNQEFVHCSSEMLRQSLLRSNQILFPQEVSGIMVRQRTFWDDLNAFVIGKINIETLHFKINRRIEAQMQCKYPNVADQMRSTGNGAT